MKRFGTAERFMFFWSVRTGKVFFRGVVMRFHVLSQFAVKAVVTRCRVDT